MPPHVRVLVNLACANELISADQKPNLPWLKIVHRLLMVVHMPHDKAFRILRSWCDRSGACLERASCLYPITGLASKLELVPMYTLVKEMTGDSVSMPLDKEPLRIQKWGKEKSALNTNEMALQRASVTKLTKTGF